MASDIVLAEAGSAVSEHANGMPQLDFSTYPNQWFWLIIMLISLYLILSRIALPRIASVLGERQGAISHDIEQAEELKQKALEAEEVYTKALAEARAEAGRIVAEAKAEIQRDLDVAIAQADAEISAKSAESEAAIGEIRKGALKAVEAVAKETAGEIVNMILPGSGDAKAVNAAVAAKLKG
ncbi:MAG: F0F1 ATP synthase subunit B' [Alphaproteobacteria bacterium]|nr:F0F1 ATP synthase subunit B' [Alphaproteobacteria bacterium]